MLKCSVEGAFMDPSGPAKKEAFDFDRYLEEAGDLRASIARHVVKHIGAIGAVARMVDDSGVVPSVDMLIVWPTDERSYFTVVTAGVSATPQEAPDQASDFRRLELAVSFEPDLAPPNWAIELLWHVTMVMHAAKELVLPFETFSPHPADAGGSVVPGTRYAGFVLSFPRLYGEEFSALGTAEPDGDLAFLSVLALHPEELSFQQRQRDKRTLLLKLFESADVDQVDVIRAGRPNVIRKRFGLF
jgi:hypothetical protein